MLENRRSLPTLSPALLVALLALVVAVASSPLPALAASAINGDKLKNRTVRGQKLKKGAVNTYELKDSGIRTVDLATGAVTSSDVLNSSITGSDLAAGTVTGTHIADGTVSANDLAPGTGFDAVIPSGRTVTGVWGGQYTSPGASEQNRFNVSLPAAAPVALTDATVNFSVNDVTGVAALAGMINDADEDATCSGKFSTPTAPSGKVCLYVRDTADNLFPGVAAADGYGTAGTLGFTVVVTTGPNPDYTFEGTWAYTAP